MKKKPATQAETSEEVSSTTDKEGATGHETGGAHVPKEHSPKKHSATPDDAVPPKPETVVASYTEYAGAQRAVDYLSDTGFPVRHTAIIGSDLRMVERVTGRLTVWRAALGAAATGIWFGLLIGFLLAMVDDDHNAGIIGVAVIVGVVGGALFGLIAHALTRGKRDFSSRSTLVAGRYEVAVTAEHAEQARTLLAKLT